MDSTNCSHPLEFFFQKEPAWSKRVLRFAEGRPDSNHYAWSGYTGCCTLKCSLWWVWPKCPPSNLCHPPGRHGAPPPTSYPATKGLMSGCGGLRIVKRVEYHFWRKLQEGEEGTEQRQTSWAPHFADLFCSLAISHHQDVALVPGHGAFPMLMAGQGEWERKVSGSSFTRMLSVSPRLYKGCCHMAGGAGGGTSCILWTRIWGGGEGEVMFALLPAYSLQKTHDFIPFSSEHLTHEGSQWSTSNLGAYQASDPSQLLEIGVRAVFYRLHKQENQSSRTSLGKKSFGT